MSNKDESVQALQRVLADVGELIQDLRLLEITLSKMLGLIEKENKLNNKEE